MSSELIQLAPPVTTRAKLEEQLAAEIRRWPLPMPVDAGIIAKSSRAIREAHRLGQADMLRLVLDAWQLHMEEDDLDSFRDTLTDLMRSCGLQAVPSAASQAYGATGCT